MRTCPILLSFLLSGLTTVISAQNPSTSPQADPGTVHPAVRGIVEENAALAAERESLARRRTEMIERQTEVKAAIARVGANLHTLQEALAMPGVEDYIGPMLHERRRQLPDAAGIRRSIRAIRDEATAVYARRLMLDDRRGDLADMLATMDRFLSKVLADYPGLDMTSIESQARRAFTHQLTEIDSLRETARDCWKELFALNILQERLARETQAAQQLIDEHMLWLPTAKPLYQIRFPRHVTPEHDTWRVLREAIARDMVEHPFWYLGIALVLAVWLVLYRKALSVDERIRRQVAHVYSDSFRLTLESLALAVYWSIPLPVAFWGLGVRLFASAPVAKETAYDFAMGISIGLERVAFFLFFTMMLRAFCQPRGLAEAHLAWRPRTVELLRTSTSWLIYVGGPLILVVNFAQYHPDHAWRDSVARIAGISGMILLAVLAARLFHPRTGMLAPDGAAGTAARLPGQLHAWRLLAAAVPLALAVAGASSYPQTAMELARHLYQTITLAVGLLIARGLVVRLVLVSRRRLAIRQARDAGRRAEGAAADPTQAASEPPASAPTLDDQTGFLLGWLMALGLALGAWFIWRDIIPAFNFVARIRLWSYSAGSDGSPVAVTLLDLMVAMVAAVTTVVLARNAPGVLDTLLLRRLKIDHAARFATLTLFRYAIVIVGIAVSFNAIQFGWSRIHWLIAAVSVGLGFGLQEIFANFVSGLIILFERPVRIGDIVTVGGIDGKITQIRIRATTVTDATRRELIVPNKEFITGQIINWTLSDPVTRVAIPVGVAYGSDTRLACDRLLQVARECRNVLAEPAPTALFKNFGDSTLDLELRVYIPNRDVCTAVIHELHTRIDDAFRAAGIEIAFPQRDVHIRSFPQGWLASAGNEPPTGASS